MNDTVKKEDLETETPDTPNEDNQPEYSEAELEAIDHGWVPEGVEGKVNLSAEEFMGRQKLYNDLSAVKRQVRQQQEVIQQLKTTSKLARQHEREKVLTELKKRKKEAFEAGDGDALVEVDDKIAEVKATAAHDDQTDDQNDPAFDAWVSDNGWYDQDPDLKEYADFVGVKYFSANPNKSKQEVYEYVTKQVKKMHPDKFDGEPSTSRKRADVEPARRTRTQKKTSKYSAKDLPDEARSIMKNLVKQKVVTEEEYLEKFFG